jgi:hypothetical protein
MTVVRLDAAALAKLQTVSGQVTLADENGNPVRVIEVRTVYPLDEEPKYTPDEWRQILDSPVKYTTEEAIARLQNRDN